MSGFVRQHTTVNAFSCSDSWVILSPIEQSIKRKIEAVGTPLKDWDINIYRGVLTGYNEAFIIDTKKRDEILANCSSDEERKKTAELIRPILRGRDIKRYCYEWAGLWLICTFPSRHYDIEEYPTVKNYLLSYGKERLEQTGQTYKINGETIKARKKTSNKWFEVQDSIAYWEDFDKPKIVWGNLNLKGAYSYAPKGMFVNAPSPFIATDNVALLHILNSKIADYYIQSLGVTRNGGYFEYKPMFVAQLPVPMTGLENLKTFNTQPSREEEGEIATTIYQIYGLSPDEIDFIEDLCI
ncbi:MAG: class I SAM-dependent DNA methyltransferase [Bacteroidales bacterium]|nr:class I SAM-dependent DNA methyltransferase [Bacteroidales bacterium]